MSYTVGMNPVDLLLKLAESLGEATRGYHLDIGRDELRGPVKIHKGIMPSKRSDESDIPFLYVYLMDGEDADSSIATYGILVGTYSMDEETGYMDALNLGMTVRRHLLSTRVIDNKYRIILEGSRGLKYTTFEQLTAEQRTHPHHYMQLQCSWQMAGIVPDMPDLWKE